MLRLVSGFTQNVSLVYYLNLLFQKRPSLPLLAVIIGIVIPAFRTGDPFLVIVIPAFPSGDSFQESLGKFGNRLIKSTPFSLLLEQIRGEFDNLGAKRTWIGGLVC